MSDKNSEAASSDGNSDDEIEVIEVKASNSLVPNLTISVDQNTEQGVEPTVEFHDEEEKMEKDGDAGEENVEFKVDATSFSHTKIYENKILKEMGMTAEEARLRKQSRAKRFQSPMLREEVEPNDPDKKPTEDLVEKVAEYNKTVDMFQEIRLDAVHLRGLDDMSTEDIFSFFDDLYPSHIEWIDDTSCNVVWDNKTSAANAIITMTKPNKPRAKSTDERPKDEDSEVGNKEEKKEEKDDDDLDLMESDEEAMDVEQQDNQKAESENNSKSTPFTNGLRRCKRPFTKGNKKVLLKMRFATVSDKKTLGGAKKSNYYRKYGNPNYGNMRGLLSRSFMKRFHGRVAHQEYKGYNPETDDAERSHDLEKKQSLGKRTMSKRMYSDKEWKNAKKAKKTSDGEEESEDSDSDSDVNKEEREDLELINSSAKDLHDAIPADGMNDSPKPEGNSMMADRISKRVQAAQHNRDEAIQSGELSVKIKGGGSVWSRLGQRSNRHSEGLSKTHDSRQHERGERVLEQDKERRGLPQSLRDRLGTRRR